jgi:pyruvate, water dikinase
VSPTDKGGSELVIGFDDPCCEIAESAGGKGASLSRMARAGLPVPHGFVVCAPTLIAALAGAGRLDEVSRLLQGAGEAGGDPAETIRDIILGLELPPEVKTAIERSYAALGSDEPVAVRSSACAEDSDTASFAGQQETYLNVRGAEDVLERVRECWASFFSERALFYRSRKGSLTDLGMAVVIQRQLMPEKSGVMFTIDPVRRRRDQMVIEAVWGLGEAAVSGRVTPDHYVVARDGNVKQIKIAIQPFEIVPLPEGGIEQRELTPERGGARVLDDSDLAELAELGGKLQAHFGSPQDVEWAFQDGQLYLLQSRPVTA